MIARYNRVETKGLPLGRRHWGGLFWLAACLAICGSLIVVLILGMQRVDYMSVQKYLGTLTPHAQPIIANLPKWAILDQVLVSRGETVQKGQTLALFDVPAMQAERDDLRHAIRRDGVLIDCLLNDRPGESEMAKNAPHSHPSEAVGQARRLCDVRLAEAQSLQQGFDEDMRLIDENIKTIQNLISILTKSDPLRDLRQDGLRALSLSLAVAKLETERSDRIAQHKAALLAFKTSRVEQISALRRDNEIRERRVGQLEKLIASPRLLAAEAGTIVKLRLPPLGFQPETEVELLEIRGDQSLGYQVYLILPAGKHQLFQVGDPVKIKLIGLPNVRHPLDGNVVGRGADTVNAMRVEIALSKPSTTFLDDPTNGIALRGASTATWVEVRDEATTVRSQFLQHFAELWPSKLRIKAEQR